MTVYRQRLFGLSAPVAALLASLLALAFALLLSLLLLPACGLRLPFWGSASWCLPSSPASSAEAAQLQAAIQSFERQLAQRACVPAASPQQSAAEPPPVLPEKKRCALEKKDANVVVVLDGSSSMLMPLATDPDLEKALSARALKGDRAASNALERMQNLPGPKRIDAARDAIGKLFGQLPPDRRIGVGFTDCESLAEFDGAMAIEQVNRFQPKGRTPIALSVLRAAEKLDPTRPGNVVLVSDGNDTCGGDVCQMANRIKSQFPLVNINVVDLAGWTDVGCLATRTGGRYMRFEEGADVSSLIAEQALTREVCE